MPTVGRRLEAHVQAQIHCHRSTPSTHPHPHRVPPPIPASSPIPQDTELLNDADYANLLGKILDRLGQEQRAHGTKLIWVNTTPVPTVPTYGPNCTNTSACLNPPRFDADVRRRNAIASKVVDAHTDLHVSTVDLYNVVLQKCGGEGYHTCDPWQLRDNVHYTQQGWELIGGVMANAVLRVAGAEQ